MFLGIGSLLINASLRDENNFGILFSIIIIAIVLYINYTFILKSSKIIINTKGVVYKKKLYKWEYCVDIQLTTKSGLILNTPTECAILSFKNSKPILIFDNFFSNYAEMKYFIHEIVINKKEKIEHFENKFKETDFDNELFIPYRGNHIFSFRGLLMWSLIFFTVYAFFFVNKKIDDFGIFFSFGIISIWFTLNSWMMHYFELSKNYFKVKNHYFFWINKTYSIFEIREIVFERQPKQPNNLRIITNTFKSKVYPAGSLTDKTWIEMKVELESKNIKVRNECIPE